MTINGSLYSSAKDDWVTPTNLFEALDAEFGFQLDAAASVENAKCARFFTKEQNSLAQDWSNGPVWLNPPYGRGIKDWMEKVDNS